MGTSSSYSGSSGKQAKELREGLNDWLDNIDAVTAPEVPERPNRPELPVDLIMPALRIPSMGRGSGAGGASAAPETSGAGHVGGGAGSSAGSRRTIASYARTAGRAGAAARALRDGDRQTLEKLGLDFDELSLLPNRAEMVRKIVEAVCDAQVESSIEADEQLVIAAWVADWVLDESINESNPDPEATARRAIAVIATQIFLTESTELIDKSAARISRVQFNELVLETATALASKASLTGAGASADGLSKAIKKAISGLRKIHGQDDR